MCVNLGFIKRFDEWAPQNKQALATTKNHKIPKDNQKDKLSDIKTNTRLYYGSIRIQTITDICLCVRVINYIS